jgi:hypothetical protein
MKRTLLIVLSTIIGFGQVVAQSCQDASVELTAYVQADPAVITLTWRPNAGATQHNVFRKLKNSSSWGTAVANLPGDATQYIDSTVVRTLNYEYRVIRQAATYTGYGYINAGIEVKAVEDRGVIILVVDQTVADSLVFEIERLAQDYEGDGYIVKRIDVSRSATAQETRTLIRAAYNELPSITGAVCLLGHVPVPYSGEMNPDGHPDHIGAWPADTYYGEMNGAWTDAAVNNTVANDERNHNKPGDGKFDQTLIPSDIELQVGRIDFFNMPAFAASEIQLLRNYLNKNHAYRHKVFTTVDRAIIDDNFGYFGGEAFASTAWKNFAPMVGFQNVSAGDYFPGLADSIYQWSYGCGGGWYQGAGGVGSTTDFANSNTKSVFTLLFGSYLGDWDTPDNFLRAPLAQGLTLTNAWSGRPHWVLHHMGLGETIGYGARLTMNNNGTYFASYGGRFVHLGLMGDPTLRNDVVKPVQSVELYTSGMGTMIEWDPSGEDVVGYNIYRRHENNDRWIKINSEPVPGESFIERCLYESGHYTYMVRAVALESTPSGTYYNMSQGITDTITFEVWGEITVSPTYEIIGDEVVFGIEVSEPDIQYMQWDLGDGTTSTSFGLTHRYDSIGEYTVTLIASNECYTDTVTFTVNILTGLHDITDDPSIAIAPNPTSGRFTVSFNQTLPKDMKLQVIAFDGKRIFEQPIASSQVDVDLSAYPDGLYTLLFLSDSRISRKSIVLLR